MDTFARLILVVVLGAFYAPSHSATYTPDFGELKVIDGDLHMTRGNGATSIMYPDAWLSKDLNVSTSKGNFPVPLEKSFPIPPSKVAKAATRFLKTLPAIGTAVAIYDTVCDISGICRDVESGDLMYAPELPAGLPITGDSGGWQGPYYESANAPTLPLLCQMDSFKQLFHYAYWKLIYQSSYPYIGSDGKTFGTCVYTDTSQSPPEEYVRDSFARLVSTCSEGYSKVDGVCKHNSAPRPVEETDWTAAETKLSAQPQQVAEALYNSDAPVPVDASTQSAPVVKQISQTSTQTKDAQGNVTGTQVATTSVKVEDTSTASNVTYNVTETTTITNYNENNEITSTQTSTSDNQPPEPPKPPEPEDVTMNHGGVPEIPLLTQVIDVQEELDNNQQTPWSAGTCPADIDLGIYGLEFSFAPFCTFAEGLRPVVLTLGAFLSFYILAGFKFD